MDNERKPFELIDSLIDESYEELPENLQNHVNKNYGRKHMAIRILLSNITYQEFMNFSIAYQTGKLREAFRIAQKAVTEWGFDADPSDSEAFLDLRPSESALVLRAMVEKSEEFTKDIDFSSVEVDIEKWTTREVLKFSDAQKDHDWKTVERMMPQVATLKEGQLSDPLTASQGMLLQMAITDNYRKVIEGKN